MLPSAKLPNVFDENMELLITPLLIESDPSLIDRSINRLATPESIEVLVKVHVVIVSPIVFVSSIPSASFI